MKTVTIDGMKYWQPECKCSGVGHICYLRPMPQTVNMTIAKIIEAIKPKAMKELE